MGTGHLVRPGPSVPWSTPRRFRSSYGEIAYGVTGHGPPVVLVHGTPWSSFAWRRIVPALAQEHTVYYYDLLGYGDSEKGAGLDVSLGVQNKVLAELLGHWALDAPALVAHDFGGATALRAHLMDGCRFSRLALVDPVALSPWGSEFFRLVRENAAVFEAIPLPIHEAIVGAYASGAAYHPLSEEARRGILQPWSGEVGRKAFYDQIAQADSRYTEEVEDRYATISVPVLIVWGAEDTWIPLQRGRELQRMIPGSRLEVVDEAGHLVQEDQPEQLVALLGPFLRAESREPGS